MISVNSSLYNAGKIMRCVNKVDNLIISTVIDAIESSVTDIVYERVYYPIFDEVRDSL